MALVDTLEQVWIVHCGRCANEAVAYTEDPESAAAHLISIGWVREKLGDDPIHRNYCPPCNQETS